MSLDKAIKHGKEKRRPYRKSKAVCYACRNHGSCPYCKRGRLFNQRKVNQNATADLKDAE